MIGERMNGLAEKLRAEALTTNKKSVRVVDDFNQSRLAKMKAEILALAKQQTEITVRAIGKFFKARLAALKEEILTEVLGALAQAQQPQGTPRPRRFTIAHSDGTESTVTEGPENEEIEEAPYTP